MNIPMFSQLEYKVFGLALLTFVLTTIFLYLTSEAIVRLAEIKKGKPKEHKFCEVDKTEFAKLGEAALRYQKMKSFITETDLGDMEVIKCE